MKKLANTVYITTEGAALRKDGENLVAEVEGVERARETWLGCSTFTLRRR
jgi:CRISPR-associated protein Cas1